MDMVRHQAISPNADTQTPASLAHQIEIGLIIPFGEKAGLAAVASLGAMMRKTGRHNTGESEHTRFVSNNSPMSKTSIVFLNL